MMPAYASRTQAQQAEGIEGGGGKKGAVSESGVSGRGHSRRPYRFTSHGQPSMKTTQIGQGIAGREERRNAKRIAKRVNVYTP